jgi:hypothetical protein
MTTQLQHVIQDYEIRLTGAENDTPAVPAPQSIVSVENPVDWPQNYQRVPPYRPIDRNLDREQRPDKTNHIDRAFIFTMLYGDWLNAVRFELYGFSYKMLMNILTEHSPSLADNWRTDQ